MAGAAALMLAGCSSEVGRFAADGKTDLTPTATIPYAPPQRTPLMSGGPVNGQGPEAASTVRRLSPIQSTPLAPAFHIIDPVIYHTTLDTPELVPAVGLAYSERAFLKIFDDANGMTMSEIRGTAPLPNPLR